MPKPIKGGISYSWENEEHNIWVENLASKLEKNGIDVIYDRNAYKGGMREDTFIKQLIEDTDFVLLICTQKYCEKYNNRKDGVGKEADKINELIKLNPNSNKFIPILRTGDNETSIPDDFKNTNEVKYIDFRDDDKFEEKITELLEIDTVSQKITKSSIEHYLLNNFDESFWLQIGKGAGFSIRNIDKDKIFSARLIKVIDVIGISYIRELIYIEALLKKISSRRINKYFKELQKKGKSHEGYTYDIFTLSLIYSFPFSTLNLIKKEPFSEDNTINTTIIYLLEKYYQSKSDVIYIINKINNHLIENNCIKIVIMSRNPWNNNYQKKKLVKGANLSLKWSDPSGEIALSDEESNSYGSIINLNDSSHLFISNDNVWEANWKILFAQLLSEIYIGNKNEIEVIDVIPYDINIKRGFIIGKISTYNNAPEILNNIISNYPLSESISVESDNMFLSIQEQCTSPLSEHF